MIILISTRKFIAGSTIEQSRQIANVAHVYLLTQDSDEQTFINSCGQKRIDSKLLETPVNSYIADPHQLPGYRRLNSSNQTTLFQSWINLIQAIFLYLFKGRSPCCREEELAKYSLTSSTCELQPIITDGILEENFEWFSRESSVFANLKASGILLGTNKIIPDDMERISLALEASPIEFRDTIYNLKKFDQRWSSIPYMDQPTGSTKPPTPKMSFSEYEVLSLAAYEVFKQPPTNAKITSIKSVPDASKKTTEQNSTKKCARCKVKGHISKDCPTPAKEDCNRFKTGKCRNGTNCRYGHPAKDSPNPKDSNTPPATLSTAGQTVYENDPADMAELTCRDCNKQFEYNATWWSKQKGNDGTPWLPPFRCKECQALNKTRKQSASSLVTGNTAPTNTTQPTPTPAPTYTPPPPDPDPAPPPATTATPGSLITSSFYSCIAEQMDSESEGDDDPDNPSCMVATSTRDYMESSDEIPICDLIPSITNNNSPLISSPTESNTTVILSQDELSPIEEIYEEDDDPIPIVDAPEILIQPEKNPVLDDSDNQIQTREQQLLTPVCWCQPLSFDGQCTRCLRCPVCCTCPHTHPYFRYGPAGQ
jgi:hypothetical protein